MRKRVYTAPLLWKTTLVGLAKEGFFTAMAVRLLSALRGHGSCGVGVGAAAPAPAAPHTHTSLQAESAVWPRPRRLILYPRYAIRVNVCCISWRWRRRRWRRRNPPSNHHRHHKTNNATQFHTIRWKFRKTWEKKWSECSTIFGRSTRASTPCLRMSDQSWIPAAVRLANPPLRPSKRL